MSPRSESGRPGSPRARLFVALDLPPDARAALVRWRERAFAGRDDVRLPDPATLHVTLVFLGYLPEKQIERVAGLMRAAAGGVPAPVLSATAVDGVPARRPRLFALALDDRDGRAGALQAALSSTLEAARLHRPERRAFWPHLTLARVKRGAAGAPFAGPAPPADPWPAAAVTLYRSTLRRQGARYDALESIALAQPA